MTAFWKDLIPAEKRSEFLRLFDQALNPCFSEELARKYWELRTRKGIYPDRDSSLANEFGEVRMNTLAMHELAPRVLCTLREAVRAILAFWMRFVPADIRQFTDPLLKRPPAEDR